MNLVIPFTKDIVFDNNIAQVLSISLEHDYTINEGELLGNFYISLEYKTHEVSVSKETMSKTLPFSVSLLDNIDINTIDFSINNFTYEIIDNNTLRVNIEYIVNAKELMINNDDSTKSLREVDEISFDELIDDVYLNKTHEDNNESSDEHYEDNKLEIKDSNQDNIIVADESMDENEQTFITYNIHIMQDVDTIDHICTKYNTTTNILEEYNDLSNLTVGDKIIIPEVNE